MAMVPKLENAPVSSELVRATSSSAPDLRVAFVNNMPDFALASAERQFTGLVAKSCGDLSVSIELYALARVSRSHETRSAMARRYGALDDLIASTPDVLIVTGAEPRAADLADETYWPELTQLIDWARSGGVSAALYSCLAAHAAVRIADGVRRHRLARKLCGVYPAEVVESHELNEGLLAPVTPHSRYNDLNEQELADNGYLILTRSIRAGVSSFVKESSILEVFWQGHPEYEADTLASEFRRDLRRYVNGLTSVPPPLPENYLAPDMRVRLDAYLADGALPAKDFPLVELAPQSAVWVDASLAMMRAFLVTVFRRKGLVRDG